MKAVYHEVKLMMTMEHEHLLKCHGYSITSSEVVIFMELMRCSVKDYMRQKERGRLTEEEAVTFLTQAADGLAYMHNLAINGSNAITHGDLKSANLLLDDKLRLKLSDFGQSNAVFVNDVDEQSSSAVKQQWRGTPVYSAPETTYSNKSTRAADIWSFSVTACEMVTGRPPHIDRFKQWGPDWKKKLRIFAQDSDNYAGSIICPNSTEDFQTLVEDMFCYEPKERLKSTMVLLRLLQLEKKNLIAARETATSLMNALAHRDDFLNAENIADNIRNLTRAVLSPVPLTTAPMHHFECISGEADYSTSMSVKQFNVHSTRTPTATVKLSNENPATIFDRPDFTLLPVSVLKTLIATVEQPTLPNLAMRHRKAERKKLLLQDSGKQALADEKAKCFRGAEKYAKKICELLHFYYTKKNCSDICNRARAQFADDGPQQHGLKDMFDITTFSAMPEFPNSLFDYCVEGETLAKSYFDDKDYTVRSKRIASMRIAVFCSVLKDILLCQDLVESENVLNCWIKKIFCDTALIETLDELCRYREKKHIKQHDEISPPEKKIKMEKNADCPPLSETILLGQHMIQTLLTAQSFSKHKLEENLLPDNFHLKYKKQFLKLLAPKAGDETGTDIGVEIAAEILRERYKSRYETVCFMNYEFNIATDFVPLTLKIETEEISMKFDKERYISTLEKVLERKRNDGNGYLTIITGKAFYGKTTLSRKIAYDWAAKERFHDNYDLLLLVPLRYVPVKEKLCNGFEYGTILDMTDAFMYEFCDENQLKFLARLRRNRPDEKAKVLIIIDGYDEGRNEICKELQRFLQQGIFPSPFNYDLMITRRPGKDIHKKFSAETKNVNLLTIEGFTTTDQRRKFIERHLQRARQATDSDTALEIFGLNRCKEENMIHNELLKSPMRLLFHTLISESDENKIPDASATIFDTIIKWNIQRWLKSESNCGENRIMHFTMGHCGQSTRNAASLAKIWRENKILQNLAAFAFKNLISPEKKYCFAQDDFEGFNRKLSTESLTEERFFLEPKLLLKTGLMTKLKKETTFRKSTSEFEFAHLRFQEYLAALYFIYWADDISQCDVFETIFSSFEFCDFDAMVFDIVMAEKPDDDDISPIFLAHLEKITVMHIRIQDAGLKQIKEEYEFWKRLASKATNCSEFIIDGRGVKINFPIGLPDRGGDNIGTASLVLKKIHFTASNQILDFGCPAATDLIFSACRFKAEQLIIVGKECNKSRKFVENCRQISFQNLPCDSLCQLGESKTDIEVNEDALWHGSLALSFDRFDIDSDDHYLFNEGVEKLLSLFRGAESLFLRSEKRKKISLSFPQHSLKNLRLFSAYSFTIEDSLLTSLSDRKAELFPNLSTIELEWCRFALAEEWNFEIEKIELDNGILRMKKQKGFEKCNKKQLLQQEDLERELEPEVEQEFEQEGSLRCLLIENLKSSQTNKLMAHCNRCDKIFSDHLWLC